MNILLKAATIYDPSQKEFHLKKKDVLIREGHIERIGSTIELGPDTQTIELEDLHISKGWFDSSVSFGEPGFEDRETIENGLKTAAKSGFTDIVLNSNVHPVPDSSSDIVFLKNAAKNELTGLYPLGTLTMHGKGTDLAELYDMQNAGAVGYYDYKSPIENSNLLKIALQYTQNFNGLVYSFPMDNQIKGKGIVNEGPVSTKLGLKGIPALAEELQLARDLFILAYAGGRLHVPNISTANSVKLISDAKKKGHDITCSVAIHHLFFTDKELESFDSDFKVMPPLRTNEDAKALIRGLKNGVIDFVTSDHTPLTIEEKRVEFDNAEYGSLGLESSFGALNTLFDTEKVIELLTKGRETYGINSAELKEGQPANLTLFNPHKKFKLTEDHILSTSKNCMFLNAELKGCVYGSVNNGKIEINS